MLSDQERMWIHLNAYLPEHIPDFVGSVSGAEPYVCRNYLFFFTKKHLIFNAYPLERASDPADQVYEIVCKRFCPSTAAVIAPVLWMPAEQYDLQARDSYYRLDLPVTSTNAAVAYMLRRAGKDLQVKRARFQREHKKIIKEFLAGHNLNAQQKYIFKRIPQFLKSSDTAVLFEARRENKLAAFNIVDLGAAEYAFYLFSFRSNKVYVPGASDLLFDEMVKLAHSEGKKAVNLGLGINAGIRRFKEKWGGVPFLDYRSVLVDKREVDIEKLAKKL